jgi:hypothetical protein
LFSNTSIPSKRGFAHRRNRKPRPPRIRIQDLLPRNRQRVSAPLGRDERPARGPPTRA